jgi:hypothetical protein
MIVLMMLGRTGVAHVARKSQQRRDPCCCMNYLLHLEVPLAMVLLEWYDFRTVQVESPRDSKMPQIKLRIAHFAATLSQLGYSYAEWRDVTRHHAKVAPKIQIDPFSLDTRVTAPTS